MKSLSSGKEMTEEQEERAIFLSALAQAMADIRRGFLSVCLAMRTSPTNYSAIPDLAQLADSLDECTVLATTCNSAALQDIAREAQALVKGR